MAWERSFEARVLKVRDRELRYQKLNYTIEVRVLDRSRRLATHIETFFAFQTLWNAIW
jgi:hypothetical protein